MFHLVHWGYSYEALREMPTIELMEIIKVFNDFKEKEATASSASGGTTSVEEAKMSGTVMPGAFQ